MVGTIIKVTNVARKYHQQVKFTIDMTGYAPAGYVVDPTQQVRGLSPLHDSGTGSSLGMSH